MREAFDQPGMVRYLVALLIGLPVALFVSAMYPDRQGAGFAPFLVTMLAALAVIWLIAVAAERFWLGRRHAAAARQRQRRRGR